MSTPLSRHLLQRGIQVFFISSTGNLTGWLNPVWNKNVILRLAQHRASTNADIKLKLAQAFVRGKLTNARSLVLRHRRVQQVTPIGDEPVQMARIIKQLSQAENAEKLLGLEGYASRVYFGAFGKLLKDGLPFDFERRNRRPPKDPVNALLSYGYTLLNKDVTSNLIIVGLDPYIGYYHVNEYGRPALALDLMEEFRPVIDAGWFL